MDMLETTVAHNFFTRDNERQREATMQQNTQQKEEQQLLPQSLIADILGISRHSLRHYNELNIINPAYVNKRNGYRYYGSDQIDEIMLAKTAFSSGETAEDISSYFKPDHIELDRLLASAHSKASEQMRDMRRLLESIALLKRASDNMSVAASGDGAPIDAFYLRYIPERIVAVMPLPLGEPRPLSTIRLVDYLRRAAHACGWVDTIIDGTLSFELGSFPARECLFVELASAPMPQARHDFDVDGGCYWMAEGFSDCDKAGTDACRTCARMGGRWPESAEIRNASFPPITLLEQEGMTYLSGPWAFLRAQSPSQDARVQNHATADANTSMKATPPPAHYAMPGFSPHAHAQPLPTSLRGNRRRVARRVSPVPAARGKRT